MALTSVDDVRLIPQFRNTVAYPTAWLEMLIAGGDATIKRWCKQYLELRSHVQILDGNEQPGLVLREFPVWQGTTQIAAASDGVTLPTSTINVVSTTGFDPGGRAGNSPTIAVQTSLTTWTTVTYTGKTATTFTGCSGGTGTLSSTPSINGVGQPVVFLDQQAYGGQAPPSVTPYAVGSGPFASGTIQVQGVNWYLDADSDDARTSARGILMRVGGASAAGFIGSYPNSGFGAIGKLSSRRLPCWPRGYSNVKVIYTAGYETIPSDLRMAATTLVAYMARSQPYGGFIPSSESLGAYSYSLMQGNADIPELGAVKQILSRYREVSW